jgi:hypothetical protein
LINRQKQPKIISKGLAKSFALKPNPPVYGCWAKGTWREYKQAMAVDAAARNPMATVKALHAAGSPTRAEAKPTAGIANAMQVYPTR